MKDLRDATPDGLRRSAFMGAFAERTTVFGTVDLKAVLGARSPVKDLRVATPDGLHRSAFMGALATRTTVSGTFQFTRVRKDRTINKYARKDLNLQPSVPKTDALSNCATDAWFSISIETSLARQFLL